MISAIDVLLLTVEPYDLGEADTVPVYLAPSDYRTGPTDTPASVTFEGVVEGYACERQAFAPGAFGGPSLPGSGSVSIGIPQQWRDNGNLAALLGYAWDGRAFTLERLAAGAAFADREVVASGTVADLDQAGPSSLVLRFHDRAEDFRRPIQTSTYGGAGGTDGTAELKNRPRPLVFGRGDNAPAIMVDPANLVLDIHDGPIEAILAVRDNGVALSSSGSNPPPSGSYFADLSVGRIVLGDSPVGAVTVDVKGAAPGGAWADDLADVVRLIVTDYAGLADPAELDTAAFTALAADRAGVVGYAAGTSSVTIAQILDALIAGAGGYWVFTRAGLFSLGVFKAPTATASTDAVVRAVITDYRIAEGSLGRRRLGIPPSEIRAQYRILGQVQAADELADSVTAADRLTWSTPNLVALPTDAALMSAIAAAHLRAQPLEVATWCYEEADAEAIADDLLPLLADLAAWSCETDVGFGVLAIGDEVWLAHPDYGISAGVAARVAGYAERQAGVTQLEVLTA